MKHGKKFNHLGRTASHRKAMLSNMASSLIIEKRISTTLAKAKALRKYIEPLITKSKDNTTHSRRVVFSYLQNKESVQELFDVIAYKVGERPGGYTRIIRLGNRLGDNAEICMMELVDFNETILQEKEDKKPRRRRRRRKGSSNDGQEQKSQQNQSNDTAVEAKSEESLETQPKVENEEDTAVEAKSEDNEDKTDTSSEDTGEESKSKE